MAGALAISAASSYQREESDVVKEGEPRRCVLVAKQGLRPWRRRVSELPRRRLRAFLTQQPPATWSGTVKERKEKKRKEKQSWFGTI
jgi:hypothetical protein